MKFPAILLIVNSINLVMSNAYYYFYVKKYFRLNPDASRMKMHTRQKWILAWVLFVDLLWCISFFQVTQLLKL